MDENKKAPNRFDFKNMHFKDIPAFVIAKIKGENTSSGEMLTGQTGKYEVNLVPAVKLKMIKMQKTRNLIFFICIVISIICGGTVALLGSITAGQAVTLAVKDAHMEKLSNTIMNYGELSEFLTIQDQLNKIESIEDNKKVLSRVFSILGSLLPAGPDSVTLSELNVNLQENTLAFDAQADAGEEPFIDYRVLESFKKAVNLMKYDYGRYVDADGNDIPTRCIIETDPLGNLLSENGAIYAIWTRGKTGCDPSRDDYEIADDGSIITKSYDLENASSSLDSSDFTSSNTGIGSISGGKPSSSSSKPSSSQSGSSADDADSSKKKSPSAMMLNDERVEGDEVVDADEIFNETRLENSSLTNLTNTSNKKEEAETVIAANTKVIDVIPDEKIWRTPQFSLWYSGGRVTTAEDGVQDGISAEGGNNTMRNVISYVYTPEMGLDGSINNIPHFQSECISYSGEEQDERNVKWSADNVCKMTSEDIVVNDSSNGRDSSDKLVLRFSAVIYLDENVFAFRNKHVMVISPTGQNVTDSYVQIEGMFAAPATDCAAGDTECNSSRNSGGV